ncbi:MAG: hypothetical protein JWR11_4427 [Mycobacterium sp.]|nr:hypothetical protein [Mycobacterium sp.]MDT5177588.1 hypothetical protein [Mycobacterium sp.]
MKLAIGLSPLDDGKATPLRKAARSFAGASATAGMS